MNRDLIWAEKYRPKTLQDLALPRSLLHELEQIDAAGTNALFYGPTGTGKTTAALIMGGPGALMINGSLHGNIDTLRGLISDYASSVPMIESPDAQARKTVILDEADYLSPQTSHALRSFTEKFASTCRFILTANHHNRIIEAILSRCATVNFSPAANDTNAIVRHKAALLKRAISILTNENVTYDEAVVAQVINMFYPDFRRAINMLQAKGADSSAAVAYAATSRYDELWDMITSGEPNFSAARRWIGENNSANDPNVYTELYNQALKSGGRAHVPEWIVILAKYSYQSAFVSDKELNLAACIAEIMHATRT